MIGDEKLEPGAKNTGEVSFNQRSNMVLAKMMLSITDSCLGTALEIEDPRILWL